MGTWELTIGVLEIQAGIGPTGIAAREDRPDEERPVVRRSDIVTEATCQRDRNISESFARWH